MRRSRTFITVVHITKTNTAEKVDVILNRPLLIRLRTRIASRSHPVDIRKTIVSTSATSSTNEHIRLLKKVSPTKGSAIAANMWFVPDFRLVVVLLTLGLTRRRSEILVWTLTGSVWTINVVTRTTVAFASRRGQLPNANTHLTLTIAFGMETSRSDVKPTKFSLTNPPCIIRHVITTLRTLVTGAEIIVRSAALWTVPCFILKVHPQRVRANEQLMFYTPTREVTGTRIQTVSIMVATRK